VAALVLAIAQEPLVAPSQLALGIELPAGFDGWFFRSCARATSDRFPDVGAQIDALAAALGNPEETAPALALQARPELTDAAAGLQSTEISGAAAAVVSAAPTTVTVAAAGASPSDAAPRLSPRRPPGRGSVARTAYVAIACGWAVASLWWIHGRIQQRTDVAVGDGAREALSHLAASPAAPPAAVPSPPPEEPAAPSPARGAQKTEPIAAAGEIPAAPPAPAPTVTPPAPARAAAARDRRPARPRLRRATEPDDVPAGASRHRLPPGQPCERSAECASGLCAAETCQ
jgi:hypothetical protein